MYPNLNCLQFQRKQIWRPAPPLVERQAQLFPLRHQSVVFAPLPPQQFLCLIVLSTTMSALLQFSAYISNLNIGSLQGDPLLCLLLRTFCQPLFQSGLYILCKGQLTFQWFLHMLENLEIANTIFWIRDFSASWTFVITSAVLASCCFNARFSAWIWSLLFIVAKNFCSAFAFYEISNEEGVYYLSL